MNESSSDIQSQMDLEKKNCIFCQIISGNMSSEKIYEDDKILCVLDINPATIGHALLIPKEHYAIMPVIPPDIFKHMFGMLPKICHAIKSALITTGIDIFIANGGIAGQQSSHFLFHILPREKSDNISKFYFSGKESNYDMQSINIIANNLPIMMMNHFKRSPAVWHKGTHNVAGFLKDVASKEKVIYIDEKVLCVAPKNALGKGHLIVYSNEEEKNFENLSSESSAHLFYTASYAATAVFEGMHAHGSNIILKSGICDDNPDGILSIHILPRWENDGLELLNTPLKDTPNLKDIAERIKDKTFVIEHEQKEQKFVKRDIYADYSSSIESTPQKSASNIDSTQKKSKNSLEEINRAIERIKNS